MKRIALFVLLVSMLFFSIEMCAQNFFTSNVKYELSLPFNIPYPAGAITKIEKPYLTKKHFEMYTGLGIQYTGFSSNYIKTLTRTKPKPDDMDIRMSNIGIYVLSEFVYYPFRCKNFFVEYEIFLGVTTFSTKSEINAVSYDLIGSYSETYTFFNYGSTQAVGCKFRHLSVGVNMMLSYKGYLDKGRKRPGDFDSFMYPGIQLSWTID